MSEENNNLVNEQQDEQQTPVAEPAVELTENIQNEPVAEILEPEAKKSKAPIIAGAVVVAAAVAVGACAMTMSSPEKALNRAFITTGAAISQRDSVIKSIFKPAVATMLNDGSYSLSQSFTVEEIPDTQELNGLGVSAVMNVDNSSKQGNFSIKGSYKGLNLDVMNLYTDNDVILFNSPMVCKSTFSVATDDIIGQIKNSPVFAQYIEDADVESLENLSLKVFDKVDVDKEAEEITNIYTTNFAELRKSIKYSKAEAKEVTLADGAVKCKGYTVDIPSTEITKFYSGTLTEVFNSSYVQEQLKDSAATAAASGYYSAEEYLEEYNEAINDMANNLTLGDVKATFYVNDGIIVDSDINMDVTYDSETVNLSIVGGLNTDNSINLKFTGNNDGDLMSIEYADSVQNLDTLQEKYTVLVSDGSESMPILNISSDYNQSTGDINASLKFGDDYDEIGLSLTGNATGTDDSVNIDASNIAITSNGEDMGRFSYDLSIDKLDGSIEKPEGDVVSLFEMNEDEYQDVMTEVQQGLFGILMQLN